jgi:hypothetical protein
MMSPRTLVSATTIFTDAEFRSDHLKLCYLWYDEVLFETIGEFDDHRFFSRLLGDCPENIQNEVTDVLIPLSRRVNLVDTDTPDDMHRGYPRWGSNQENYDFPEPENTTQFAHNAVLRRLEAESGVDRFRGIVVQHAEGRARVAVDAVGLWERVNAALPCVLQASAHEKVAMLAAQEYGNQSGPPANAFGLFDTVVPSLRSMTWTEVGELRQRGGFGGLRQKIQEAFEVATGDPQKARAVFQGFEDATTNEIVERFRPSVRNVTVEAILTNLPGLPLNPFGFFTGGRDIAEEVTKRNKLDWFYLLRDMRGSSDQ